MKTQPSFLSPGGRLLVCEWPDFTCPQHDGPHPIIASASRIYVRPAAPPLSIRLLFKAISCKTGVVIRTDILEPS